MNLPHKKSKGSALLPISCFAISLVTFASYGQDTLETDAVDEEQKLEKIIVTSQKRYQNLQETSLAVSAFTGEMLESRGIVDIKGVAGRTPGFTIGEFNAGQTQLFIRGIGSNEDGAGGDQSVVVFVDDAYLGRSAGQDIDLFDVERVEVLRGPQGTLFGRNVIGGAVNVITQKPSGELDGAVEATVGTLGTQTFRGKLNFPISETLSGKASFSSKQRDGYLQNREGSIIPALPNANNDKYRNIDRQAFRAGLRWQPNNDTDVNFTASHSTVQEDSGPRHSAPGDHPNLIPAYTALVPDYFDSNQNVLQSDPGKFKNEISGFVNKVEMNLSNELSFTSVTSYRDVETNDRPSTSSPELASAVSALGFVGITGSNYYDESSQTTSQELRLNYDLESLKWVGGVYYLNEKVQRLECSSLSVFVYVPSVPGYNTNPTNLAGCDDAKNKTTSYAVFSQFTYDLNQKLSVDFGLRYTKDTKDNQQIGTPSPAALAPSESFSSDNTADFGAVTGKFSLNYQASKDIFYYANISRGFKSGGFGPGLATTQVQADTPFDEEYATLYEVGAKTEFFNNRLRLNTAIFHTSNKDLQVLELLVPEDAPENTPGQLITQNAADAQIRGIEIEFTAALTDRLIVSGNYAYLDSEYIDFFAPVGFRSSTTNAVEASRIGNQLRNAPKNAYNINLEYRLPLEEMGEVRFLADFRHKDIAYQDAANIEFAAVPEYNVTDMRVTWSNEDETLSLTGWVNNVFDEEYYLHNYAFVGIGLALPAPPRTAGVTLRYNFY
tara:strand:+ start:2626 stop:4962 length:2337 start_codon:yes stop_codon:yes gene_type:complete